LYSIRYPNSLAWVYSQVTQLLGFRKRSEEHKTQWLGMTGEPVSRDLFVEVLRRRDGEIPWPASMPDFSGVVLQVTSLFRASSTSAWVFQNGRTILRLSRR
jgi:hypothetical protein